MTRSKEMRRIQDAITHCNEAELRWALADIEVRKTFQKRHSNLLYRLEQTIRTLLAELDGRSD